MRFLIRSLNFLTNVSFNLVKYYSFFHITTEYVLPINIIVCSGSSMEPTLHSYDVILAEKYSVRRNLIRKNDIVIAKDPFKPIELICKRVRALPGDRIDEQDLDYDDDDENNKDSTRYKFISKIIPYGYVYLIGDNSHTSYDSRDYGPIPYGLVQSRALMKLWPLSELKFLRKNGDNSNERND